MSDAGLVDEGDFFDFFDDPGPDFQVADLGKPFYEATDDNHAIYLPENLAHMPPPAWLIEPYVIQSGLTFLFGEPGVGKTFLALDWAVRVANRVEAVGEGGALYVLGEGTGEFAKRVYGNFQRTGRRPPRGALMFTAGSVSIFQPPQIGLATLPSVHKMLGTIRAAKPGLVVFDTLARVTPGADENAARDMNMVIQFIDAISQDREFGRPAVLVLHHSNRAGKGYRGSSVIEGAADIVLELKPSSVAGVVTLRCQKMKDYEPFRVQSFLLAEVEAEVPRRGTATTLVPEECASPGSVSGRKGMVLDVLAEGPASGVEIQEQVWGHKGTHAHNVLKRLEFDGLVYKDEDSGEWIITAKGTEALP